MRIALISDMHGNPLTLEAVLDTAVVEQDMANMEHGLQTMRRLWRDEQSSQTTQEKES